jgi:hypothetical protein
MDCGSWALRHCPGSRHRLRRLLGSPFSNTFGWCLGLLGDYDFLGLFDLLSLPYRALRLLRSLTLSTSHHRNTPEMIESKIYAESARFLNFRRNVAA